MSVDLETNQEQGRYGESTRKQKHISTLTKKIKSKQRN